jgi:hypothetical protein
MGFTSLQPRHLGIANSSSETTRFSVYSSEYSSELAVRRHWDTQKRLTLQPTLRRRLGDVIEKRGWRVSRLSFGLNQCFVDWKFSGRRGYLHAAWREDVGSVLRDL